MSKYIFTFMALFLLGGVVSETIAQGVISRKDKRAMKHEERTLHAEGWETNPDVYLNDFVRYKYEKDDKGNPIWQIGTGTAVDSLYDLAYTRAKRRAEQQLKLHPFRKIPQLYDLMEKKNNDESQTITSKMKSINSLVNSIIYKSVGIFDARRNLPNGKVEVMVSIGIYTTDMEAIINQIAEKIAER